MTFFLLDSDIEDQIAISLIPVNLTPIATTHDMFLLSWSSVGVVCKERELKRHVNIKGRKKPVRQTMVSSVS